MAYLDINGGDAEDYREMRLGISRGRGRAGLSLVTTSVSTVVAKPEVAPEVGFDFELAALRAESDPLLKEYAEHQGYLALLDVADPHGFGGELDDGLYDVENGPLVDYREDLKEEHPGIPDPYLVVFK